MAFCKHRYCFEMELACIEQVVSLTQNHIQSRALYLVLIQREKIYLRLFMIEYNPTLGRILENIIKLPIPKPVELDVRRPLKPP